MLATCSQCPFFPQTEKQHKNKGLKLPQIIHGKDLLLGEIVWDGNRCLEEVSSSLKRKFLPSHLSHFLAMTPRPVTQWKSRLEALKGPSWPPQFLALVLYGGQDRAGVCVHQRTLEGSSSTEEAKILWHRRTITYPALWGRSVLPPLLFSHSTFLALTT